MGIGRLVLRVTVGSLFVGHGVQKLFGWCGGHGLEATAESFEQLGLRPGRLHALLAGTTEAGSGALLVAGYATPLAAAGVTATMATAIDRVHARNGPWVTDGGFEYNLVLMAAALVLAETGPGALAAGRGRHGTGWALAALGAGLAGAATTRYLTTPVAAPESAQDAPQGPLAAATALAQEPPSAAAA